MDTNTQNLLVELIKAQGGAVAERMDLLQSTCDGINGRLDLLNSRTRKNEVNIVRIKTLIGIAGTCVVVLLGAMLKHYLG